MKRTHAAVSLMLLFIMTLSSMAFAVSPDMTDVYGTVYDINTNQGIQGAFVNAHCVQTGDDATDPNTDSNGNYIINSLLCSIGHDVIVTVTKDNVEIGSDTKVVVDCTTVTIPPELSSSLRCSRNVHVGIVDRDIAGIPEFPIAAIPALLSIFSFGLIRKRLI